MKNGFYTSLVFSIFLAMLHTCLTVNAPKMYILHTFTIQISVLFPTKECIFNGLSYGTRVGPNNFNQ